PLSALAITIIAEALAEIDAASKLVFSGRDGGAISPVLASNMVLLSKKPSKAILAGGWPGLTWSAHDLRRTSLTGKVTLGIAPIVLAHVANPQSTIRGGVTFGVYVRHDYAREKREALELWAERLAALVGPQSVAQIVELRRA